MLCLLIQLTLGLFRPISEICPKSAMEAHQIVPELIDSVPPHVALVNFASDVEMNLGAELTPLQTKDAPIEINWPTEPNSLYSVVFTDPDAPSRAVPLGREVLHWLVVNIPGNELSKGDVIAPYGGPGAPDGTGLHRYVLFVFKQTGPLAVKSFKHLQTGLTGRLNFNTRTFASQQNLGIPVAGNFFNAQCDDYIRKRNSDLLESAIKKDGIMPNVIEHAPTYSAGAFYRSKAVVRYGNELTVDQVREPPALVAWRTEPNALYTLIMIAHHVTVPKTGLNWLVVNIPGSDISKGETLNEYIVSSPPDGSTGLHILLIFKQQVPLTNKPKSRNEFELGKFIHENKLGVVPVAGNFYKI